MALYPTVILWWEKRLRRGKRLKFILLIGGGAWKLFLDLDSFIPWFLCRASAVGIVVKPAQYSGLVYGVRDIDLRSGSLRSSAGSALHLLCGIGQVCSSLWVSVSLFIKWCDKWSLKSLSKINGAPKTCNILSLTCHIFQVDTVLYLLGCCEDQVRSGRRFLPQLYWSKPWNSTYYHSHTCSNVDWG